ncbi:alpha/beta hydrolase [Ligilactobacillus salitolerans]|uniref:Alpha/beta hydrolase n=1 Tax=Ligilactobacillus salitolerans TaxID=1808352 RepID=A0A401IV10_9LACO|nr:alpha/beta hydrolase [Ligilactobacillus salitolerans]GBG95327.1 alpha/beta hydrolase [Ligilactobacillus salitolerans]
MKETISIGQERSGLWQDTNVTYAQVPGWLGHATRDLKLTVIRHFEEQAKPMPLLVWFAGGGWMDVDHNIHLPNLVDFARAGFVVASVEYRHSNIANWPAQLEDAKAAIRYLKAHADKYQINKEKVIVMGESAGGHLASMTALTSGMTEYDKGAYLEESSAVCAAVPWYGVVDPLSAKQNSASNDFDFVYRNLLGAEPEEDAQLDAKADPLSFVEQNQVPFLILHGTEDEVVPVADSEQLYQKLIENQHPADLIELQGAQHMDPAYLQPEVSQLIIDFIKKHV